MNEESKKRVQALTDTLKAQMEEIVSLENEDQKDYDNIPKSERKSKQAKQINNRIDTYKDAELCLLFAIEELQLLLDD